MLIFLLLFVFIGIYWYFKKTYRYWKDKNVVSLPTWPIIGSQMDILSMKKHQIQVFDEIYNRYPTERIVGGFRGTVPELFVRDPEIIRMILVKDFNYFHDRHFPSSERDFLSQNLFLARGEKWRLLRQKLTPTFTSSKMKQMFPLIVECGETLQKHLAGIVNESEEHEIREIMARFTTDTIGSCAFGLKMESMTDDDAPFRKIGRNFFSSSKLRVFLEFLLTTMPNVALMIPISRLLKARNDLGNFILNIVQQLVKSRSETPSSRHDFIDLMLELRNKGFISGNKDEKMVKTSNGITNNLKITDEVLAAQAFVFFIAGFETSSSLMTFALRELAFHPKAQDKLSEEINRVLEKHDGLLTYDAVQEMEYLEMIINETLRKYPPLGFLSRKCISQYNIPKSNVVIDKGVVVMIPTLSLHYDAQYFPDPEKFIPERFAKDAEKTFHPYSYLPFGDGPRNCIGLRFGKLQAATGLISILRKYSVEVCDRTPKSITYEPTSIISMPVEGVWLKVKSRK